MSQVVEYKQMSVAQISEYIKSIEPKSFQEVIESKAPSFRMITQAHDSTTVVAILIVELTKICQLLSFNITGEMITECAKNIADEFWYCKLDDLKLFKTYLFRNKLPVEMYRNDALVLYKLFEEYELLRHREFTIASDKRRQAEKAEWSAPPQKSLYEAAPPTVRQTIDRIEAKMEERKKATEEKVYTAHMTLEALAESVGIDIEQLAAVITEKALDKKKAAGKNGASVPDELWKTSEIALVTYEARLRPLYLQEYIITPV